MKKTARRKNSCLLDQHKYDKYNTNKSQNCQSNNKANRNKITDLNIGQKTIAYGSSTKPEAEY